MLPPIVKPLTKRQIASRQHAEEKKQRKLHAIGERRAKAAGMTKKEYIAEIVKGKYRPITAEDIDAEPDPKIEADEAAAAAAAAATA